jgi:hypothetical protein
MKKGRGATARPFIRHPLLYKRLKHYATAVLKIVPEAGEYPQPSGLNVLYQPSAEEWPSGYKQHATVIT